MRLLLLRCVLVVAGTGTLYALLAGIQAAPVLAAAPDDDRGSGVLGPLNPDDPHGIPLDHYQITADVGGFNPIPQFLHLLTSTLFAVCRWVIGLATWLVDWALDFKVVDYLFAPAVRLIRILEQHLITGTGLVAFCLTLAAVVCGWWIMRGRHSKGFSELAVTLVIAAAAAAYLSSPATTIFGKTDGALAKTRDTALEVAALIVNDDDKKPAQGSTAITREIDRRFMDAFVRYPHQAINYGQVLDDAKKPHKCLRVYNQTVRNPDADGPATWERMAACDPKLAKFNQTPSFDRLGAALLSAIAAGLIALLAIVIAITLLVAQLWLVFEVVRLVFALVVGLVPGAGRVFLYKSLGGLLAALATVVATIAFLALFVLLIRALLTAARGDTLFVRFLLLNTALFCGFAWYKRLVGQSRATAGNLIGKLGTHIGQPAPPNARAIATQSREQLRPAAAVIGQIRPSSLREKKAWLKQQAADFRNRPISRSAKKRWTRRKTGGSDTDAQIEPSESTGTDGTRPPSPQPKRRIDTTATATGTRRRKSSGKVARAAALLAPPLAAAAGAAGAVAAAKGLKAAKAARTMQRANARRKQVASTLQRFKTHRARGRAGGSSEPGEEQP